MWYYGLFIVRHWYSVFHRRLTSVERDFFLCELHSGVSTSSNSHTPRIARDLVAVTLGGQETGGGGRTTENGRHFKAFCEKHGRAPLEDSWLMQVPRYQTAYTPFASLLLWSIWICHCVKLAPRGPSPRLPPPRLPCSRYFALCLSVSSRPFLSLAVTLLRPLFKVSFCSSLCAIPRPLPPYHPHFLSVNSRCSAEKSKSPLAAARTGLQKRAWRDKKRCRMGFPAFLTRDRLICVSEDS